MNFKMIALALSMTVFACSAYEEPTDVPGSEPVTKAQEELSNVTIDLTIVDVGDEVNVVVENPLSSWTLLKRIVLFEDEALVTVPALNLTDVPAVLLKSNTALGVFIPPNGNIDLEVRMPTGQGPTTITGVITTMQH